jgi:hypothetical protein
VFELLSVKAWRVFGIVPLLLAGVLAACSTETFQFGKGPVAAPVEPRKFPADYKPEVADFIRRNTANPTKIRDAYIAKPVLKPVGKTEQYVTCVRYNPRDSQGKYEGPRQSVAIFLSGNLNQFLDDDPQMCAGLTYERYPEIENMVP